jgi:hypothetical protein
MKEVKVLPNVDVEKADKIVQRSIKNAFGEGKLYKPEHESMICACGHEGKPLCIIDCEEFNMFVCPKCGDA